MRRVVWSILIALLGCSAGVEDHLDPEDSSLADGRADATSVTEPSAEADLILALVNDPATNLETLDHRTGLHRRAAQNIVAYRNGADGVAGNGDDERFDSLAELDAIKYVGPYAIEQLLAYATRGDDLPDLVGFVTGTLVSGLELEEGGDICVFFFVTEDLSRYGIVQDVDDCLAAAYSEHPDAAQSNVRISGTALRYLRDASEIRRYKALDATAFYLRLIDAEAVETVGDGDGLYCEADSGDPDAVILDMQWFFGGETARLIRGSIGLNAGDVIDVGPEESTQVPTMSVTHPTDCVQFEVRGPDTTGTIEIREGSHAVVDLEHAGEHITQDLECQRW